MIYENIISDIDSCIYEPWRMCGEYEDGFTVTVGGNDEGIKKELAEAAGGNVEDVVLYKYSGSVSIPTYKVA